MLNALKRLPRLVDGISGARTSAAQPSESAGLANTDPETEPSMNDANRQPEDTITSALAQVAQGLAQAYAERERPARTGRLHRV